MFTLSKLHCIPIHIFLFIYFQDFSRESEVLKPTNPSAQKALLNDNQYKVALLPTAKIKPKPWTPSPTGKVILKIFLFCSFALTMLVL